MGLFSFFKKAGSKSLVDKNKEAAAAKEKAENREKFVAAQRKDLLESIVRSTKIDVRNLDIDLKGDDNDVVHISGEVDSQAEKEKVVLAVGNVNGVGYVDENITVKNEGEIQSEFYEVQSGDSLSKIAKQYYGDPMKYTAIFEANKPMLSDPDKIYPGQTLRIPKNA